MSEGMMKRLMLMVLLVNALVTPVMAGSWTSNNFLYKPALGAAGQTEKNIYDSGLDKVDARLGKQVWVGDPNYGSTVADAVAAIATAQAILHIYPGTHNINNDLAIPNNITLCPEHGAVLNVASGKTLTINGPIRADLWQIFSGPGTVAGDPKVEAILPQWFGAKGDNSTDDASAINKAAALARAATCKTLRLPPGAGYKVTQQLDLTKINIESPSIITTTYAGTSAIVGDNCNNLTIRLVVFRPSKNWAAGNVGIEVRDLRMSRLDLSTMYHEVGVKVTGTVSGGNTTNTFHLRYMSNNKVGLFITNTTPGWVTDNLYLNGSFGCAETDAEACVKIQTGPGANPIDNQRFYKPIFEYNYGINGVIFDGCLYCSVHEARIEGNNNLTIMSVLNGAQYNRLIVGSRESTKNHVVEYDSNANNYCNLVSYPDEILRQLNEVSSTEHAYKVSTDVHVPGFEFIGIYASAETENCTITTTDSDLKARGERNAPMLDLPGANYGLGWKVKWFGTIYGLKKLLLHCDTGGTAYVFLWCYDSNGNRLSGTSPYYVQGRERTALGNFYRLKNPYEIYLHKDVATILIGVAAVTGGIKNLAVFANGYLGAKSSALVDYSGPQERPGVYYGAAAPTKWGFMQGQMVHNTGAAAGGPPGWVCVKRVDTTLTVAAAENDDHIHVASISGIASSDVIGILLDSGFYHFTTVNGAPAGDQVNLTEVIPTGASAAIGKRVVVNLWKAMPSLAN
jgi:hypothetical protein